MRLLGILDDEEILVVVSQVLAEFVAQVGVRVAIAHDLDWLCTTDATMIGSDNDLVIGLSQLAEEVGDDRVAEPRECYRAIGTLVIGQLTYHLRLGSGVAEHIDEIEHHHVEVVLLQRAELL